MRAYMSDRAEMQAILAWADPRSAGQAIQYMDAMAAAAEYEVRAILAETEAPSGASYYVRDARDLRAGECLADALRAFVEA